MGALAIIGLVCLVVGFIKAACEKELPADYHRNWKLEWINVNKVDSKKRKNYTGINMASFWLGVSPWL